jgi:type I restriction enzyme, R subunit
VDLASGLQSAHSIRRALSTDSEHYPRIFGEIPELFKNEDELRSLWSRPDTRKALLSGLAEKGYGDEQLAEMTRLYIPQKAA